MENEKIIENKDNDDIKQAIKEIKKSVDSIHTVLTYILFFMIIPIVIGLLSIFGSCGR
ncbi:MAG: hypothetical protein KA140_02410 [Caldisericia bacterium]|nr:hypothetical protein [Caldisericia bacterium]